MVHPFLVSLVSRFVNVHQHEVPALLHAFSAFFFVSNSHFSSAISSSPVLKSTCSADFDL